MKTKCPICHDMVEVLRECTKCKLKVCDSCDMWDDDPCICTECDDYLYNTDRKYKQYSDRNGD